jgi:hypothetical protein
MSFSSRALMIVLFAASVAAGATAPAPIPLSPVPHPLWNAAVAVAGGRLYAFGGTEGKGPTGSVLRFDPVSGDWTTLRPMPEPNLAACATDDGGAILMAGGWVMRSGSGVITDQTWRYDPRRDEWRPGPALPEPRASCVLTRTDEGLALIGGFDWRTIGLGTVRTLRAGVWSPPGGMPVASAGASAAVLNGIVYVAGGSDASPSGGGRRLSDFFAYDPRDGRWTPLPPMPTAREGAGMAVLDGRVYVAGGNLFDRGPSATALESYDPATRAWTREPPMPYPRSHPAAAALAGRLYVFGGAPLGGQATRTAQVYDPRSRRWTVVDGPAPAPPAPQPPPRRPVAYVPPPPAEPVRPRLGPARPHDYAIVVGVEDYKSLPRAEFAASDARAMAAELTALGVPEENIVTLTGSRASLSELSKYVEEWLPRRVTKDSRVYFYYSGHGSPDVKDGSAYLMPWDADAAFVKSTGFPLARLYRSLGDLPARRVVAMLDACFSGAGGRSVLAPGLRPLVTVHLPAAVPPNVTVLAASESGELAGSLPARGHGLFSYYLLSGLSGAADADGDGHVTVSELYAYARKRVILDARRQDREQTPTLTGPGRGMRLY